MLNVHRNHMAYQGWGEGGGGGKGVWRLGEMEIIYLSLHCHHQNDFCIRWAAMRAILLFYNCEGQCPQTTTFEEKGEPKQIRTEVPLLTSLTLYR